jgi:hypothetical protein
MSHYCIIKVTNEIVNVVVRNNFICTLMQVPTTGCMELNTNSVIIPKQEIIHNNVITVKQQWTALNHLFDYYVWLSVLWLLLLGH